MLNNTNNHKKKKIIIKGVQMMMTKFSFLDEIGTHMFCFVNLYEIYSARVLSVFI